MIVISMEDRTAQFFKVYANLPQAVREEIIAVIDREPYTWQSAKLEVEHDTIIGKKIIDFLVEAKILQ